MRRVIPTAVMMAVGLVVLLGQFGEFEALQPFRLRELSSAFTNWASIIFAFALILGLLNLLAVHWSRIRLRVEGWAYSVVLIVTVLIVLVAGLSGPNTPSAQWVFRNVQVPLQSTMLSLLVFFIASAVFRALRVRSLNTFIMLTTALIVLLGQMPIGERISLEVVQAKDWILSVPNVAGARGILLGVALGTIATGLRLLFGVDREKFFH